jgi:predicted metal-dependent hydrolase
MPQKVVMLQGVGKVTLSQSNRSKRIKLSVRPNRKVMVSFPEYVTFREAADFAVKNSDWIIKQQQKYTLGSTAFHPDLPVKTRFHTLYFRREGEKFSVKQKKFEIYLCYPEKYVGSDPELQEAVNRVLVSVYRWEANHYLPGRISELARAHGFSFNRITIRDNRSNWGSCSSRNNISLNLHLMKLPDHLIDYVLLHELVHTKVKNHSAAFWSMLDSVTGGRAGDLTHEMKKYSVHGMP